MLQKSIFICGKTFPLLRQYYVRSCMWALSATAGPGKVVCIVVDPHHWLIAQAEPAAFAKPCLLMTLFASAAGSSKLDEPEMMLTPNYEIISQQPQPVVSLAARCLEISSAAQTLSVLADLEA